MIIAVGIIFTHPSPLLVSTASRHRLAILKVQFCQTYGEKNVEVRKASRYRRPWLR